MQKLSLATLKYTLVAIGVTLSATVIAEGQYAPGYGTLPPPGPYMSSRPILVPAPEQTPLNGAAPMQSPTAQHYPAPAGMQPSPSMPMQPAYGYNPGMPPQGYRPQMPYRGMPYRYNYPQATPWQQPPYGPQQGGWNW